MKNFGIGLALGLIGLIVCIGIWIVNAFGEPLAGYKMPGYDFFMGVGRVIGIGGVVTFWIILPVVKLFRKEKQG